MVLSYKKAQKSQNRKKVLAGLITLLTTCAALAQNPASQRVDFSLRSIDGQNITSESLRGEIVVLAFGD